MCEEAEKERDETGVGENEREGRLKVMGREERGNYGMMCEDRQRDSQLERGAKDISRVETSLSIPDEK